MRFKSLSIRGWLVAAGADELEEDMLTWVEELPGWVRE